MSAIDTGIIALYLAGMLVVGLLVSRRIASFHDFFLAGGRMSTPLLVCTLVSTYYGLDVTFGTSETSFLEGMSAFFAYSAPFYVAYLGSALLVAPRLRRLPVQSLPEAMGHFYGRPARAAAACASFVYSAPILSVAGMGIFGRIFLGWEPWIAASVGAGIALIYTVLGGLWADALTDTVQFVVMCVSLGIAAALAMVQVGNHAEIGSRLGADVLGFRGSLSVGEIVVFGMIALTPLIEPAFYQRILAASGTRTVRNALLIGLGLWLAYDWVVVYVGLVGRDLVASGALPADTDASEIVVRVTAYLLPPGLLGLFVAGCLAAAMSTIDSYTIIAAGNVVYDGWQSVTGRRVSDRALLRWTRVGAVVTLAASVFLSLRFERLRDAWIFMSTVLLSTVFVPMLAGLFVLRRPRPRAGCLAALAGLAVSLALFVAFEIGGRVDPVEETRVLQLPLDLLGFAPLALEREGAIFLTLPVSLVAFAVGWGLDRRKESLA